MIVKVETDSEQALSRIPVADRHLWQIRVARDVLIIVAAAVAVYGGYYFWDILAPLVIAALLAFIFHPLVTWAHARHGVPRVVSTIVIMVLFGGLVAALALWLGPHLVAEISQLVSRIPGYVRTVADRPEWAGGPFEQQLTELAKAIQERPYELAAAAWPGAMPTARFFGTALGVTTYTVLVLVLLPIYFFFFCWRFDRLHALDRYVPTSRRERVLEVAEQMGNVFSSFFRGRLIGAAILAVLFSVGLWLADVPYWFLLAIISALLNIIPYAAFIGWFAVLLIKYVDGVSGSGGAGVNWVDVLIWPTAVYLVVQAIDSWLITPVVQSHSVNLNPVTVIVVLFAGGGLAGLVGLLLAIPVAACIKILIVELVAPRVREWAVSH